MENFKCTKCGCDSIEEVLPGVTQTSVLTEIVLDDSGDIVCDYEPELITTDGGYTDQIRYQCTSCGQEVSPGEMRRLAKIECADCTNRMDQKDVHPWKYEPEIKLCEGCHDARMEEEME